MPTFVIPGARDQHVFDPLPGVDYAAVALTAWLSACHRSFDIDQSDTRLTAINERQQSGHAWFSTHDAADPHYQRARQLKHELLDALRYEGIARRCAAQACWLECCTVFSALSLLQTSEATAFLTEHLPSVVATGLTPTHPNVVWTRLRGTEKPFGAWPALNDEWRIDARIAQSPTWDVIELAEALERRRPDGSKPLAAVGDAGIGHTT